MERETVELVNLCKETLDLSHAKLSDSYYYCSLPIALLDAIFSIGVHYTSTKNTVDHYCIYYSLPKYRNHTTQPNAEDQHKISDLIQNIECEGIVQFSKKILCNAQRTSTTNGILKGEAVYLCAKILQTQNINTLQDFNTSDLTEVEEKFKSIPGQKSGKSFSYLKMLCGDENTCKPDRHIINFVAPIMNGKPSDSDITMQLQSACFSLQKEYPLINLRLLDHAIWKYMSSK